MAYYNGKKVDVIYTGDTNAEILEGKCSNAIKNTKNGVNAIRIDDITSLRHDIEVKKEVFNLVDHNDFISKEAGEGYYIEFDESNYTDTYYFQALIKDGVDLQDKSVTMYCETLGDDYTINEYPVIEAGNIVQMPFSFSNPAVENFTICFLRIFVTTADEENGVNQSVKLSDIFEAITITQFDLITKNISEVSFETYGKNLLDDVWKDKTKWGESARGRPVYYFDIPPCSSAIIHILLNEDGKKKAGSLRLYEAVDGENYIQIATLWQGNTLKKCTVVPKAGYKYMLWTSTTSTLEDVIKGVDNIQVEIGDTATSHELYKEPKAGAVSVYPTMTLVASTIGVEITATYNQDAKAAIDKAFNELKNAIINLGGTV